MRTSGLFLRVCNWGAHRLLTRLHRITHRQKQELRAVCAGRVMVLAPHMDDEVIPCGGTLALHRQAGSSIGVVYISDSAGDPQQTGTSSETTVRKGEAEACARMVGFEILAFLDFPDGSLSVYEWPIAQRLGEQIDAWKPDQIFVPFPTDHHRDHQATAAALALALQSRNWDGEVWGYEVWSTLWPNTVIDISSVCTAKREAIACHVSQMRNMGYLDATLGLNRYRGLRFGVSCAEAFYVSTAAEYVRLTRELLFQV